MAGAAVGAAVAVESTDWGSVDLGQMVHLTALEGDWTSQVGVTAGVKAVVAVVAAAAARAAEVASSGSVAASDPIQEVVEDQEGVLGVAE